MSEGVRVQKGVVVVHWGKRGGGGYLGSARVRLRWKATFFVRVALPMR